MSLLPGEALVAKEKSNLYEMSGLGGPGPALGILNRADGKAGAVIGGACGASLAGGAARGIGGRRGGLPLRVPESAGGRRAVHRGQQRHAAPLRAPER